MNNISYMGHIPFWAAAWSCLVSHLIYRRLSGPYSENLKERLRCLPPRLVEDLSSLPRIWLHAVSL
jgi:hypothetical protein